MMKKIDRYIEKICNSAAEYLEDCIEHSKQIDIFTYYDTEVDYTTREPSAHVSHPNDGHKSPLLEKKISESVPTISEIEDILYDQDHEDSFCYNYL